MSNYNILLDMACPNCGSDGPFYIAVAVFGTALVYDDGISYDEMKNTESEFNEDVPVRCFDCDHTAPFADFTLGERADGTI